MRFKDGYLQTAPTADVDAGTMSRREFLKRLGLLGGGLIIYCAIGDVTVSARTPRQGFLSGNVPTDFNAFIRITADNRITCFVGKIEMGQGPITSFAQMAAEELDVAYEAVDMVMGDTELCPWDAGTWGSLSTRLYGNFVTEAACEAKGVLKELAAERFNCPVARIITGNGKAHDSEQPAQTATYGELTAGKVIEKHLKDLPPLKSPADYTISGKPYLRRDALEKVTGNAQYAGDIRLPGMVYAKILRPPAHGARQLSADTSAAERIEGVEIVRDGDLLAVLHPYPDAAQRAVERINAQFTLPETGINDKNIFDHLLKMAPEPSIASQAGDVKTGEKGTAAIIEETYLNNYVSHAPMETHTALAHLEGQKITIWASTQAPFAVQREVAQTLGFQQKNVRVITPFVGGGFGGKGSSGQAVEAARLARKTGKPVMVMWSRAEEFFYDTFRPAAVVKIRSGLDNAGHMQFWDYHVYFAGRRACEIFYDIPHHRESVYGEWNMGPGIHPFAVGPWRAPAANTNVYARDLHLNLMAAKAGKDPLEFRLGQLKDRRMRSVLEAAAKKFGWTSAKTPSGRGFGISCGIDAETYVATMAEVAVDEKTGMIDVKRVVCAQDMGRIINPQGATIQMEGCITMGLGYALREEIRFDNGRLMDTNFDTYTIPSFSWLPKIETVLVPNPSLPPKGGGEPAIICMGGVLATAVHDATGATLRQLPMTPERVKKALAVKKNNPARGEMLFRSNKLRAYAQ
ncbi:MAG: xanthine dehydrogenase family protein molybdopterin-binding subunit [Desulfobacteraceae bacterium]|nr:xanthine dehydrogenase family protein molybdopterin-binding subunit [Desulfobacteraceae bacterium]